MERRLTTILSYDAVGYSRAIGVDESGTLQRLKADRRNVIDAGAIQHGGRTIKLMGDGGLMEFASVVDAVSFAVRMHFAISERDAPLPENKRLRYRIGINVGDVIVDGDDIFGEGVNVAARLEGLAEPGGICIRRNVRNQVRGKLDLDFKDLGEVEVRNIERPIRAFHIVMNRKAAALAAAPATRVGRPQRSHRLWQAAAGLAFAALMIAGVSWWQPWAPDFEPVAPATMVRALPAKPSIAVLPFDDLSQGDDEGYLSDAVTEGIITGLSRFPELFVITRNSSFHYRDAPADLREIARELGVRYILEGSQQKAGGRLRVTVQLIDAVGGNHVWAETYDRELADIFVVQDEISGSVASTLGEKLKKIAGEEAKRADPATLRAYEHVLKGIRYFREYTREGSDKARLEYEKALAAVPNLAEAHAGLSWVHVNGYRWGWTELDRTEALRRARQEARTALDLAPDSYLSHFAMAHVHMQAGERIRAIAEFEKTLELNPNAGNVMATFAEVLGYAGRFPEAVELLQEAMRLDPQHPKWFFWNLGWAQYSAGNCEDALATMQKMSRMPAFANRTLAAIFVCLSRMDEARAAIAALMEHDPEYSVAKIRLNFSGKYQDPADLESWIGDLRIAGLPE